MQFKRSCILYLLGIGYLQVSRMKLNCFVQISFSFMIFVFVFLLVNYPLQREVNLKYHPDFCLRADITGQWQANVPSETNARYIAKNHIRDFRNQQEVDNLKFQRCTALPWQAGNHQLSASTAALDNCECGLRIGLGTNGEILPEKREIRRVFEHQAGLA